VKHPAPKRKENVVCWYFRTTFIPSYTQIRHNLVMQPVALLPMGHWNTYPTRVLEMLCILQLLPA